MLTEHRLSATQSTGPEATAGKVQGGVLLLFHCCFPTIGALCSHSSSSTEAFPSRFRLVPPEGPPPCPALSQKVDILASSITMWATPRLPLNVKHCDHHTRPSSAKQTPPSPP